MTAQGPGAGLDAVLSPRSVAVIGASRNAGAIGHQIVANLVQHGFQGPVFPINPHARAICSIPAYPSIAKVSAPVDLAVIAVNSAQVLDAARQCADAGVRGLVVLSAGFREVGPAGADRERALLDLVRAHGMRMVGPNCLGVVNTDPAVSLDATFARQMPPAGPIAFVSQSGALGLSVVDYACEYEIGISQFVSVGNKADVSGNDLLEHWENDPTVGAILMYVESFGNPARFRAIASRVARRKPIVALKAGRSRVGARAAGSHTGALANNEAAVDALLTQSGVLRASCIEELFDIAMAFGSRTLPRSRRTAVVTNSGGPGILAADALDLQGLELPDLAPDTTAALAAALPAEASLRNPVDLIATVSPECYRAALDAVLGDPAVDAALAIFVPPFASQQERVAESIRAAAAAHPQKTVFAVLMGREGLPEGRACLHEAGIPAYVFPESAARALAALERHREWLERPVARTVRPSVDVDAARAVLDGARRAGRLRLNDAEAFALLTAYGVPTAFPQLVHSAGEAARVGAELGFPVVMKISSPDILHKSDGGGVVVGVASPTEARAAFEKLVARAEAGSPSAHVDGVLVQPQIAGRETVIGVARDPLFGPLVMFGLGGIWVEALHDVVFRLAPLDHAEAAAMVSGIRSRRIFEAIRGQPPVDSAALADAIVRVATLAVDFPEIVELDVNPLFAQPDGAVAADARVLLAPARGTGDRAGAVRDARVETSPAGAAAAF